MTEIVDTWHLEDFQMPGERFSDFVLRRFGMPDATPPEPLYDQVEHAMTKFDDVVEWSRNLVDYLGQDDQDDLPGDLHIILRKLGLALNEVELPVSSVFGYAEAAEAYISEVRAEHARQRFPWAPR